MYLRGGNGARVFRARPSAAHFCRSKQKMPIASNQIVRNGVYTVNQQGAGRIHMKCKYCGAELNEGELFCYRCGKQAEPEPAARFCIQCGAELEADAAFCWRCGASVDVEAGQESDSASAAGQDGAEADDRKAKTEALVVSAQGGDSDSFTELYQLYYQKVFALAKTTVKTDADAEDVLQMTFLKAWNNLDRLKNPSAFSTWIQRITLNQCYSLLRKKHADVSIDNDDEDAEPIQLESDLMLPEVYAERSDLKARLGKIIRELSAVQQQTITLYYYDELPVENIAWIMDCSVNTVKSRLFLARKSIKTEIEEQERKSGQPFYGVIGLASIPFGKLFVGQMESTALPESAAAEVLRAITKQIARRAAGAAGQAAGTAAKGAAKVGVKTATKAVSTAVSRKIIAGIVAGALATGAVAGGTAAAVSAVRKDRAETAQVQSAEETPGTAANGPYGQDLPTVQPTEDDPRQQELQAAYQAYLDCLVENKSGIDNYIWQRGYAIPLFDDNDNSYFAPLTDEYLARPVVLCDVCGDEIPELIYMGDVAPGEWKDEFYYNETGANLHIVTYRDGKLVDLFSSDRSWDDTEYCFPYSLFQVEGGKELYATYAWGDDWEEDTLYCFQEGSDGKLHQTQVCRYYFEGYEGDDNGSALREPEYYYGADETEIPKEEYDRIRNSKIDHISNPLMYNYYGIWDVRPAVEQHGCPAMTCDEAIAYLRELLNAGSQTSQPYAEAFRAYRDHLIAEQADIDSYVWQYEGWTEWYDWEWDEEHNTDYALRSDRPIDETTPVSRPVAVYDLVGDSTPELLYIRFDADARLDFTNMSHLVILTYRDGQLVTMFDREWEYMDSYEGASGFRIYASASEQYGLLVQWFDGMTEWSLDVRDVFTCENGTMNRMQLLSHEQGYDEEADSEIHTYRLGDAEIDSHTYETYAEQWEQTRGRLLLYSGNRERADDTESISMTCEEAIAWLEKQLEGGAPTVSLPADMPASFWQSSGVGAWSEDITFRADGTIVGEFHDTDAGWDGDGYDWTVDYSSYTCRIGSVRKINSYTYSFVVESVEYDHPIWKEEIVTDDGERIRYCYTTGSFAEGAEVTVYLRNAPIEAIPEPALELYETATAQQVMSPMPCWVLYCERTNGSFFSDP